MSEREELIPFGRAIWQSDTANTYRCPFCGTNLRSQYEGDEIPTVSSMSDHRLRWEPNTGESR